MRAAWEETLTENRTALADAVADRQREAAGEFLAAVRTATETMTGAVGRWSDGIADATVADADRAETLRSLADSLAVVAERSEARTAAAERIDGNLHALAESGRFEEAVHSLTAAAHLLTARAGGVPAAPTVPFAAPRETRRLTAAANREVHPCVAAPARPSACSRS